MPKITGKSPEPVVGFSFTQIDHYRVALFGGWIASRTNDFGRGRVNEVFILDMEEWVRMSDKSFNNVKMHTVGLNSQLGVVQIYCLN